MDADTNTDFSLIGVGVRSICDIRVPWRDPTEAPPSLYEVAELTMKGITPLNTDCGDGRGHEHGFFFDRCWCPFDRRNRCFVA